MNLEDPQIYITLIKQFSNTGIFKAEFIIKSHDPMIAGQVHHALKKTYPEQEFEKEIY